MDQTGGPGKGYVSGPLTENARDRLAKGRAFPGSGPCNEEDDMLKGFRTFVLRGNVIDLAVGVIIGAAFGGIVDSMVKDLITPLIGLVGGTPDFSTWKAGPDRDRELPQRGDRLPAEGGRALLLRRPSVQRVRDPHEDGAAAPAPRPRATEVLLTEIRDL